MARINVTKPSIPPFEEYSAEIKKIWDNVWLTNYGPIEQEFTAKIREYLGVSNATLFVNGHQALYSLINVLGLYGEVITTPFTFASTTHAIVQNGLRPVFADVDPVTYTLDPACVEKLITPQTAAILPVHVYGNLADVEAFEDISERYGIPVIYDAAHIFGVTKDGVGAGNFGTASMFSFHATKIFNSIEGGAVVTKDADLSARLKRFSNFGLIDGEFAESMASNCKMNEFSAAMGICNLRHIDEYLAKRKNIYDLYTRELFEIYDDFDPATGEVPSKGLKFLPKQAGITRNYAYYPVMFRDSAQRDAVMKALADNDIYARRYFYPLTSEFSCYKGFKGSGETPIAENLASRALSIPFYADLEEKEAMKISSIINEQLQ